MAHTDTHTEHAHSNRLYYITFAILAVLTTAEVAIFIINESGVFAKWIEVTILLILSFAKGALVVSMFMHLRGDAGIFKFLFVAPFFLASAMVIGFKLLYLVPHVGIAG